LAYDQSPTDEIEDEEEEAPTTFLLAGSGMSAAPAPVVASGEPQRPMHERLFSHWRSSWNVPAAAIGLVLLIGIVVFALSRGQSSRVQTATAPRIATRIVDSAGGNVYESVVPLPRIETDTGVLSARATDWTPPPKRRVSPPVVREPVRTEAPPTNPDPAADFLGIARPPGDSVRPGLPIPTTPNRGIRRDSLIRDTSRPLPPFIPAPVRRDTTPRPDTTTKRDTTALRR